MSQAYFAHDLFHVYFPLPKLASVIPISNRCCEIFLRPVIVSVSLAIVDGDDSSVGCQFFVSILHLVRRAHFFFHLLRDWSFVGCGRVAWHQPTSERVKPSLGQMKKKLLFLHRVNYVSFVRHSDSCLIISGISNKHTLIPTSQLHLRRAQKRHGN